MRGVKVGSLPCTLTRRGGPSMHRPNNRLAHPCMRRSERSNAGGLATAKERSERVSTARLLTDDRRRTGYETATELLNRRPDAALQRFPRPEDRELTCPYSGRDRPLLKGRSPNSVRVRRQSSGAIGFNDHRKGSLSSPGWRSVAATAP